MPLFERPSPCRGSPPRGALASLPASFAAGLVVVLLVTGASAEPAPSPALFPDPDPVPVAAPVPVRQAVGLPLTVSNFDAGGGLSWRLRLPGGTQLGLDARALAVRTAYLDGYATKGGRAFTGTAQIMLPLLQTGPLEIHLRAALGAKELRVDESTGPHRRSATLLGDVGPVVNVRIAPHLGVRTGWLAVTNFQLSPGFDVESLGQVLLAGAVVPVTNGLQLHADVETGGLFGFDGDGGKYLVRGVVGARWVFGGAARSWLSF